MLLDTFARLFNLFLELLKVLLVLISDLPQHLLVYSASLRACINRVTKGTTLFAMNPNIIFLELVISRKLLIPAITDLKVYECSS